MHQKRLRAKGIFLDLDGTLVDSTDAYIEAAILAFKALGKVPPQTHLLLEIPRRMEQYLTIDDITGNCTQKFMPIYLQAFRSLTERKTKLLPNTATTLRTLTKTTKIALITMRHVPNQVIQKELDYHGIAKYFNHIVTGLDTLKPKPAPEALIQCKKALDLEMCDCLIAGDSVIDIRAGKAAGAITVAVLSGLFGREALAKEKPDLILQDLTQLPQFIE
jgi:HAD superfamily hydrolase (TIGR01549 family)